MKTRVLQHYTRPTEPPVGLWWVEDGSLRSVYADDHESEEIHGRQVMSQKVRGAPWPDYFDALEETTPFIAGWESVEVSVSPDQWLKVVRKLTRKDG